MPLWPTEYRLAVHIALCILFVLSNVALTVIDHLISTLSVTHVVRWYLSLIFESVRVKTNNLGSDQVPTQTGLYIHRRWLEAGNFGFRK